MAPGSETGTGTDSEGPQRTKSKKTLKRKRRATSPSRFGAALETLLQTDGPDGIPAPLSLQPGVARRHKEEKLERGARKLLEGEKKEQEDKGRVKEVIGGWGVEGERALRKVAQRGVITLFNAIQQSQAAEEPTSAARATRRSGKPTLKTKKGLERGADMDQDTFLDIIRAG